MCTHRGPHFALLWGLNWPVQSPLVSSSLTLPPPRPLSLCRVYSWQSWVAGPQIHHWICIYDEDIECLELPKAHSHILWSNDSPRKNGNHERNEAVRHPGHIKSRIREAEKKSCVFFFFLKNVSICKNTRRGEKSFLIYENPHLALYMSLVSQLEGPERAG